MEREIEHDAPSVQFDRAAWSERLQAGTKNNPGGNGYLAVVVDRGPVGDRFPRPDEVFNSRSKHAEAGVFDEVDKALRYAERWREARVAQLARVHELRIRRGLALSDRLRRLGLERGHLEEEAKAIARKKKDNETLVNTLVREANDPHVELDLRPSSDAWRLYDAPAESDGTILQSRQLVLEHTGLDPIVPAEAEPDEPPPAPMALRVLGKSLEAGQAKEAGEVEDPAGRKLPTKVQGRGETWCKPGDRVVRFAGPRKTAGEGWLVEIDRFLKGGAFGVVVVDDQGVPHHLANHQIQRTKRGRGAKAPVWPPAEMAPEGDMPVNPTSKWPAAMRDRDGRPLAPGAAVRVLGHGGTTGYIGKLTGDWGEIEGDSGDKLIAVAVEDTQGPAAGKIAMEWRGHVCVVAETKAKGANKRPGLNPADVVWPEDDGPAA